MRLFTRLSVALGLFPLLLVHLGVAQNGAVLFKNVRIFDGVNDDLVRGNVLVEGDTIARISSSDIAPPASAVVIEGANRILTPGFIDLHAHLTMAVPRNQMDAHPWVIGAAAGNAARSYLMSGFTTVRDGGGGAASDYDPIHTLQPSPEEIRAAVQAAGD